jgi:hypothetical protein
MKLKWGGHMFLRIEHEESGTGPYHLFANEIIDGRVNKRHPSADKDIGSRWNSLDDKCKERYLFGFKNYRQAFDWFDEEDRKTLAGGGYAWKWYEASEHIAGKRQIAFIKKDTK